MNLKKMITLLYKRNIFMRILHTSDWHLGKRLDDFPRIEEQIAVLKEICEISDRENIDAIVISGDLFDTYNPPVEAVDLLYKTLKKLTDNGRRAVISIAGNHDSPDRIESPDPLARECGIIFAGYPNTLITNLELESGIKVLNSEEGFLELKIPGTTVPLRILITPYANEYRLKVFLGAENNEEELRTLLHKRWQNLSDKYCDEKGINILVSHLFVIKKGDTVPEEPDDEKPVLHVGGSQVFYTEDIPSQIQYTALGHLHRMHCVDNSRANVWYSGSPLSYSFAEANQQKYVLITDIEMGQKAVVRKIELKQGKKLLRKRVEGMEEALQWLGENQNSLVELTIVTKTFLTAKQRNQLSNAHSGIVAIIPEVLNPEEQINDSHKQIDLSRSMKELFCDYFKSVKRQEPNRELMDLFSELLSEEEK